MSERNPADYISQGFFGCLGALGLLVLIVVMFSVGFCSPSSKQKPTPPAERPPSKPCDVQWSETEIGARRATRLLRDMDVNSTGLVMSLDEERLAKRPEGTLESLVAAADCAIAGPTGHMVQITVRGSSTGGTLATYSASDLLALRERER